MFNLPDIYRGLYGGLPKLVCEVGVNEPDKCSVADFIRDGIEAILVEPLPWCAENLRRAFPTACVLQAVCGDSEGKVILYDRGEGSWIGDVPQGTAPDEHENHSALKREGFNPAFVREVESITFDKIDPGTIDILCVDTEGAEWFVVKRMVSVPRLVRLETHFTHSGWKNPFTNEIHSAMLMQRYTKLGEDVSDSLWALI